MCGYSADVWSYASVLGSREHGGRTRSQEAANPLGCGTVRIACMTCVRTMIMNARGVRYRDESGKQHCETKLLW